MRTWVTRLQQGRLALSGRITEGTSLPFAGGALVLAPGFLSVEARFTGAAAPRVEWLAVRAAGLAVWGPGWAATGDALELVDGDLTVDRRPTGAPGDLSPEPLLLAELVERLWDVEASVCGTTCRAVAFPLGGGFRVELADGAVVSLRASGTGCPDALRLCEPLVVDFDGDALRLAHTRLGGMAQVAGVRVEQAVLHPDGSVKLAGGATRVLELAVRTGLAQASARVTGLVRTSPSFARVREFLAEAPG